MPPNPHQGVGLAVLPFRDLSPDQDQGHLALGFGEDLVVELTRFPALEMRQAEAIAGAGPDGELDAERARALGVAYVLRGSVRRDDSRLRVNVRLVELESGRLAWGETFDAEIESLFAIQDEIVARVAGALAVHVDETRLARARRTPLGGLTTYDCWLRGLDCLRRGSLEADEEARTYFERAIELDPAYPRAWAGLSLSYFNEWSCQVWHLFEENEQRAFENAQRAAELDDGDAVVHLVLGRVRIFRREFDTGRRDLERALALTPNDPDLLANLGILFSNLGEPERALELARRAQRLNPRHPVWYHFSEALPLFLLRRFDQALVAGARAGTSFVDVPAYGAAAAALLGDRERARRERERFEHELRLKITFGREPEPGEALRWLLHVNRYQRDQDQALFLEGLHAAGIRPAALAAVAKATAPEREDAGGSAPRAGAAGLRLEGNVFRREADTWTVAYQGEGAHLAELKGFHDLARLLERPHQPVYCVELAGALDADDQGPEILDARARREIEARIAALDAELDVAERNHDLARAERTRDELEILREELGRALGLGGRPRRMGDPVERARTAVTWRIRSAIKKLRVAHPRLGRHLENSVRTGTFCVYAPEQPVEWRVERAA